MDFRFWPEALPIFAERYGGFDLISSAGSAKNVSSPAKDSHLETIMDNIATSILLHGTTRIVLTNHTDCGGYGGSAMFNGHDHEVEFHSSELKTAERIIRERFPEVDVETVILHKPDGHGELRLIEVS